MIRPSYGLLRSSMLPFTSAILALGLSVSLAAVSSWQESARRTRLPRAIESFLREYGGPIVLVAPLALALAFTHPPVAVPQTTTPAGVEPAAPAAKAVPFQDALVMAPMPQQVIPVPGAVSPGPRSGGNGAAATGVDKASPGADSSKAPITYTYTVEQGETIGEIAEKFGVSVETVLSANDIDDPAALQIGTELTILPVSGLVHVVAKGDTLMDVASDYGVSPESIASYNALSDPESLQIGEKLVVPGGKVRIARAASSRGGARPSAPSGSFQWPTTGGISTYFSAAHRGIDIMSRMGVPVYAADGGTVVTAVKGAYDYGNYLVVDHGNGYRTLYAHLSAFNVEYVEKVGKGECIGAVGSTGLSTGPHLHFEVWENGSKVDPLNYLP